MENMLNNQEGAVKRINEIHDNLTVSVKHRTSNNNQPWIVFTLQNTKYAINANNVHRASLLDQVVPMLGSPTYCPGIIWDRGEMILLLDLRALFEYGDYLSAIETAKEDLSIIIIIDINDRLYGMIVDKIVTIGQVDIDIEKSSIQNSVQSRYISEAAKFEQFDHPVYIITPENFKELEISQENLVIDWNGRIDIRYVRTCIQ